MDQLTEKKCSKIKRANSQRVRRIFIKFGFEQEQVTQISRIQLMESVAKEWLAKKGTKRSMYLRRK